MVKLPITLKAAHLKCTSRWQCATHGGHVMAHGAYLVMAAWEGHGLYGYASIAVLVFTILVAVTGQENPSQTTTEE